MGWFLIALEKYIDFNSRSRRKEFWMFYLIYSIISAILSVADDLFGLIFNSVGFLSGVFGVFMFIPYLSVSVRRLHDVDKSGWYLLLMFLPIIGWIWLLILFVKEGDQAVNQYGVNPKNPITELDDIGVDQNL